MTGPDRAGVARAAFKAVVVNWRQSVAVALVVLLAIFVLQNTGVVEVRLLFWKVEMSRALMLLVMLGSGLVAGWLLATLIRRPRS